LVTKFLAVVFPNEWIPIFPLRSTRGKVQVLQALNLDVAGLEDLSAGEQRVATTPGE
jgi:hypothetical protein